MSLLVICWFKICGNRYIYIYISIWCYRHTILHIHMCNIYLYTQYIHVCIHSSLSCFVFYARNLVVGAASGFVAQTVRKGGAAGHGWRGLGMEFLKRGQDYPPRNYGKLTYPIQGQLGR